MVGVARLAAACPPRYYAANRCRLDRGIDVISPTAPVVRPPDRPATPTRRFAELALARPQ